MRRIIRGERVNLAAHHKNNKCNWLYAGGKVVVVKNINENNKPKPLTELQKIMIAEIKRMESLTRTY